mmetsp:Transcript_33893/g.78405  ORF Transcript_33893/g.78405 Transcript_33893/m.78405 type:complete len:220 (-) Transcript_33893:99-758(-)
MSARRGNQWAPRSADLWQKAIVDQCSMWIGRVRPSYDRGLCLALFILGLIALGATQTAPSPLQCQTQLHFIRGEPPVEVACGLPGQVSRISRTRGVNTHHTELVGAVPRWLHGAGHEALEERAAGDRAPNANARRSHQICRPAGVAADPGPGAVRKLGNESPRHGHPRSELVSLRRARRLPGRAAAVSGTSTLQRAVLGTWRQRRTQGSRKTLSSRCPQ